MKVANRLTSMDKLMHVALFYATLALVYATDSTTSIDTDKPQGLRERGQALIDEGKQNIEDAKNIKSVQDAETFYIKLQWYWKVLIVAAVSICGSVAFGLLRKACGCYCAVWVIAFTVVIVLLLTYLFTI